MLNKGHIAAVVLTANMFVKYKLIPVLCMIDVRKDIKLTDLLAKMK